MGFLDGKHAVITGGGRGIGKAIALEIARNGADVLISGLNREELEGAAAEIASLGKKALIVLSDVTKDADRKRIIASAAKGFGRIDILVNNAGVAFVNDFFLGKKETDQTIAVNLAGTIHLTREAVPLMRKQKSGIIINISSVAGKHGYPELPVYCATKFGIIGFTEAIAQALEKDGILAYAICPTSTQTKMWEQIAGKERAAHVPADVALEIIDLLKNTGKIRTGTAIDVRKHV
ncbi:MAG: SDR family oxidoreductase [Candidatus Micrarchaeia archaeon]|jgi:NAD(P)-dependent dehydrogenase (short-subunit alcohol dehydrogenase family)